jgi:hypothetical protein
MLGIGPEDQQKRFGHMLKAFEYGAPPHGGFAYGIDRVVMILAGEPNIREVTPFPKDQKAKDLLLGAPAAVPGAQLEELRLRLETELEWERLSPERAVAFWSLVARAPLGGPVSLRLGALLDGIDDATDLLAEVLDDGLLSAGLATGSIRWAGDAAIDALRTLRRRAAEREVPVTLERAPGATRRAVGHFGAYREGVGQLVGRLRESFDPKGLIAVALEGTA